jgi:hypothetical protein
MLTMKTENTRTTGLRVPRMAGIVPVFLASTFLVPSPALASERWATLEAIHQLENPQNSPEPGTCGELGAYQFREETWKMHTTAPFSRALDRRSSDAVAVKHYEWIKAELARRGLPATPYMVALAWNGGIKAVLAANPPAAAVDYASRAANLAEYFVKSELAFSR